MVNVMVLPELGELIRCERGLSSVEIRLGGLYWDMSSCRHWDREWADLDMTLKRKGYLLKLCG